MKTLEEKIKDSIKHYESEVRAAEGMIKTKESQKSGATVRRGSTKGYEADIKFWEQELETTNKIINVLNSLLSEDDQ